MNDSIPMRRVRLRLRLRMPPATRCVTIRELFHRDRLSLYDTKRRHDDGSWPGHAAAASAAHICNTMSEVTLS